MTKRVYPIFSVYGIEIEYMIVDEHTLDPKPIADLILESLAGQLCNEVALGMVSVSNELALHIIELKTTEPTQDLRSIEPAFMEAISKINQLCHSHQAILMPTGAHPWFDPTQAKLWSHGSREIYHAYDRIFGCQGHGWVNLQSTHLNLPFGNEQEFVKLHQVIRYLLPIMPALTASTPMIDGKIASYCDTRLSFYGSNQRKIPEISGQIIPEPITGYNDYQETILQPMYQQIAPSDPEKILQHEWLNSRGSIVRFERDAIEIRILDSQECVAADLACIELIVAVLKMLTKQDLPTLSTQELAHTYQDVIKFGGDAKITDSNYLDGLQLSAPKSLTGQQIWQQLFARVKDLINPHYHSILTIIIQANLSQRIKQQLGTNPSKNHINQVYQQLIASLKTNSLFICQSN